MAAQRAFARGLEFFERRLANAGLPRPEFWIDERTCRVCYECDASFSFLTRKHHCRVCGRVFCGKCSSHSLPPPDNPEGDPVRVCNFCHWVRTSSAHPGGAAASPAAGGADGDATSSEAGAGSGTHVPAVPPPKGGGGGGRGGGGGDTMVDGVGDKRESRDQVRGMPGAGAGQHHGRRHSYQGQRSTSNGIGGGGGGGKGDISPVSNLLGSTQGGSGGVDLSSSDSDGDSEDDSGDDGSGSEAGVERDSGSRRKRSADGGSANTRLGRVCGGSGGGGGHGDGSGGGGGLNAKTHGGYAMSKQSAAAAAAAAAAVAVKAADAVKGFLVMPAAAAIAGSAGIFEPSGESRKSRKTGRRRGGGNRNDDIRKNKSNGSSMSISRAAGVGSGGKHRGGSGESGAVVGWCCHARRRRPAPAPRHPATACPVLPLSLCFSVTLRQPSRGPCEQVPVPLADSGSCRRRLGARRRSRWNQLLGSPPSTLAGAGFSPGGGSWRRIPGAV